MSVSAHVCVSGDVPLCVYVCVCRRVSVCVSGCVGVCMCVSGGAAGTQERIGDTLVLPPGLCPNIDGGNLPTLNSVSVLDDIA